jgi:hypothetical protein
MLSCIKVEDMLIPKMRYICLAKVYTLYMSVSPNFHSSQLSERSAGTIYYCRSMYLNIIRYLTY